MMRPRSAPVPPGAIFLVLFLLSFNLFYTFKNALALDNSVHLPYYSQLAWSFLHGHLDLIGPLPQQGDLSPYNGKIYAYWPPLTALLMAPLVWIRGVENFPQRLLAILFGALNVGLFYLLAERLRAALRLSWAAWLTPAAGLFFGWGTSNLIFCIIANHWLIGQLTASTFLLLGLWLALDRHPGTRFRSACLGAGAFAISAVGRQHFILAWPLWGYLAFSDQDYRLPGSGSWIRRLGIAVNRTGAWKMGTAVALPILISTAGMLWYNHARFGRWLENGITYHNIDPRLLHDFHAYGYFNFRYIPTNIYYMLLRLPGFEHLDHQPGWMGFSLLAQTPLLFILLAPTSKTACPDLARALWIAAALLSLPILTILSPGYGQYGARYLFDIMPFLAALAVLRVPYVSHRWFIGLGLLSIVINAFGPAFLIGRFHF